MVRFSTARTFHAFSGALWSIVSKSTVATLVLGLRRILFLSVFTWFLTVLPLSNVVDAEA